MNPYMLGRVKYAQECFHLGHCDNSRNFALFNYGESAILCGIGRAASSTLSLGAR
jgi:hypothetical protein